MGFGKIGFVYTVKICTLFCILKEVFLLKKILKLKTKWVFVETALKIKKNLIES